MNRYSIEVLSNGYTRVFDRESLLSALYYTTTGLYYTGDLPQENINQFTQGQTMDTLTALQKKQILDRLTSMNWNYGRGDIRKIDYVFGKVYIQYQYGYCHYSFRLKGNTVYYRGHQSNYTKPFVVR